MLSRLCLSVFATLAFVGVGAAQEPDTAAACAKAKEPSVEQLQALARHYHPEALTPATNRASILIVFVLDASCRVLSHTTSRRAKEAIDIHATLATLFPSVRTHPFLTAGIAYAYPTRPGYRVGRPWIVWEVIET